MDDLLTRGVANIIPNKKELEEALASTRRLNVYLGIDPTATKIHLGHAVVLRKLALFARAGHHVTFLIGDFTALVGDTSDKDSQRPILTPAEIEKNFETYKIQAGKILDFSLVRVRHNSEWLKKLTYEQILKLKQHFSLNDFISRELIKKRLSEGKNVGLLETEYPIMQGYDSYFMDTDIQIGGADQTFNMQAGRILQEDLRGKESFILSLQYLTGTDGRKMSKSWGNAIWLDDTPSDMYRKVMAIHDDLIIEYFTLATDIPEKKIKEAKKKLDAGINPRDIKKELAYTIVSELYSDNDAKNAKNVFEKNVQKGEIPADIQEYKIKKSQTFSDALIESGFLESKSDLKRVVQQGGTEMDGNRMDLADLNTKISDKIKPGGEMLIKVGKHKFLKLIRS